MKQTLLFFVAGFMLMWLWGCQDEPKSGDNDYLLISLDKTELELSEGDSQQLTAEFFPTTAKNTSHKWYSADESVASVNESGLVTAVKEGKTTITAVALANNESASCSVTVLKKAPEPPAYLNVGGGIEFDACPFGLGYLDVTSESTGYWHIIKDFGWQCTATYSYQLTGKITATFYSKAYQSATGRTWTISANLTFDDYESGTATYTAYAPTDSEAGTTKFKIYSYYPASR